MIKMVSVEKKQVSDFEHFTSPPLHLIQTHLRCMSCVDMCKIVSRFLQAFEPPLNHVAPRGTIVRRMGSPIKQKNTDNLFDYQCLSLCFGVILPRLKWSWRESNPRPNK